MKNTYIIEFPVSNGQGYSRHTFDTMEADEVLERLSEVKGFNVYKFDGTLNEADELCEEILNDFDDYANEMFEGYIYEVEERARELLGVQTTSEARKRLLEHWYIAV